MGQGVGMSETAGGLQKITIAFEPEEVTWLKAQKARPGRPSFAVVVRQAVRAAMAAESQCQERAS